MRLLKKNLVMVIELNDFIHVYDDVLNSSICNSLIEIFETYSDKQERIENNKRPNFTQFNLTQNSNLTDDINQIHKFLISIVFEYKKKYYEFVDSRCFPSDHAFEQFRIKRYVNDGNDMFDAHVDVTDHESSRRFLSFMWYLNDVNDGGETVFDDLVIKPKTGRMIVFPPLWMFPHIGKPPVSNSKYIISTYLHYK
jgi:prolyl 4-hydroxylase